LTTAGLQAPRIPLFDTAGKTGGVLPAQKEATELKSGKAIGFDNICPSFTLVMLPLRSNIKSLYKPAFNPGMVNCPVAVEAMGMGPVTTPVSAGVAWYIYVTW
jgi:hypothetical protein